MIKIKKEERLRHKILLGYLIIIGFVFLMIFIMGYFYWRNYVQQSISKTMLNNNYLIKNSIDYYFDDVVGLSEYPFMDESIIDVLRKDYNGIDSGMQKLILINDKEIINKALYSNIFYMNKKIFSVWLFMDNADSYCVKSKGDINSGYNVKDEKWFETVREGNGKPYIIGVHKDMSDVFNPVVISVARCIIDPVDGKYLGMIVINTLEEQFSSIWESSNYSGSIIAVSDKNNHFVFHESSYDEQYYEAYFEDIEQQYETDKLTKVSVNGNSYYLMKTQLSCLEGYIYQLTPANYTSSDINYYIWWIFSGIIILFAVLLIISVAISNSVTKPISKLVDIMEEVGDGNLQIQTEKFSGELEVLSKTFNSMIRRMNDIFFKLKEKEREKRDMEILALQSQINPHFLYNTLNSIRWLSEIQGADTITQMLDAFINVLRYTATDTGEYVLVRDEVEFIKNYIKILNFRYFERFSFLFEIDDDTLDYQILKFILQPIVENAVLHGFEAADLYATIKIKIYLEDNHLVFYIEDNGKGLSEERISEVLTKENPRGRRLNKIGIYNVNKRVQLLFGEEYSVRIFSKIGGYTKVMVRIPAIMGRDEDAKKDINC